MDLRGCRYVKCVEKLSPFSGITIGQVYRVREATETWVLIQDDQGHLIRYVAERFIPIRPSTLVIDLQETDPWT